MKNLASEKWISFLTILSYHIHVITLGWFFLTLENVKGMMSAWHYYFITLCLWAKKSKQSKLFTLVAYMYIDLALASGARTLAERNNTWFCIAYENMEVVSLYLKVAGLCCCRCLGYLHYLPLGLYRTGRGHLQAPCCISNVMRHLFADVWIALCVSGNKKLQLKMSNRSGYLIRFCFTEVLFGGHSF